MTQMSITASANKEQEQLAVEGYSSRAQSLQFHRVPMLGVLQ